MKICGVIHTKLFQLVYVKCPYDHQLTNKTYLSAITVTGIFQSFTYKMAAKTSWHRYGTKLRHCRLMYTFRARACCRVYATGSLSDSDRLRQLQCISGRVSHRRRCRLVRNLASWIHGQPSRPCAALRRHPCRDDFGQTLHYSGPGRAGGVV